ncbi:hypothetical protein ACP0HM_19445 [Escherichia coli]
MGNPQQPLRNVVYLVAIPGIPTLFVVCEDYLIAAPSSSQGWLLQLFTLRYKKFRR